MKIDFQFSIAGHVEVDEKDGTLEASRILADYQRNIQFSADTRSVHIDGITLGWKERPLTPLEIMQQQMATSTAGKDPITGTSPSDEEILAERKELEAAGVNLTPLNES